MPCDLILALDAQSPAEIAPTMKRLSGTVRWAKVGLELYTACGPDCVREVASWGFQVFLDLKLHDIPNTVAKAVESASKLPIGMLTLHTGGGRRMMETAARAQREHAPHLTLLGVTVLTSLSDSDLAEVGVSSAAAEQVVRLGRIAAEAGIGGLVCSPHEIRALRAAVPPQVRLVTPGVRPAGAAVGDQSRVMTPGQAAGLGSDFIVVGRPVFSASDPVLAARAILDELAATG